MLMRLLRPATFAIACSVVSACAAPVSSPSGAGSTFRALSSARTFGSGSTIVASDASQNDVVVCGLQNACNDCKAIGGGLSTPQGVATSGSRSERVAGSILDYVADFGNQRVVIFNDVCKTLRVLDDSGYFPVDVAVAYDGTVAVTNLCAAPSCNGPGNISFYAPGSSRVTRVATGLISQYYFGDFDKAGNFYNDGYAGGAVAVDVVARGSTRDKATRISGIEFPGGIQIARNGTINVDDQYCRCIQIYSGRRHVGTISLPNVGKPVSFALDKSNAHLWVTDETSGKIDELPYPGGVQILNQLSGFSAPVGVGVVPPDKP